METQPATPHPHGARGINLSRYTMVFLCTFFFPLMFTIPAFLHLRQTTVAAQTAGISIFTKSVLVTSRVFPLQL